MALKDLINLIKSRHQKDGFLLNPPASEEEIQKIEKKLGFKLPSDFKEFYSICNGFECNEDIFNFLSLNALLREDDYGKDWVVFAEYMIYSDTWSLRKLQGDNYEIFYNDGEEIILTNSLSVFLEKLSQGHVFEEGGLYDWHNQIKKLRNS